mmetsp:Transcript_37736/g.79852  ORF Transcript_37736/g.79852 Transcript_37736/m.79852 type:complete len:211 (+) Transcript_37736:609-1241(+)
MQEHCGWAPRNDPPPRFQEVPVQERAPRQGPCQCHQEASGKHGRRLFGDLFHEAVAEGCGVGQDKGSACQIHFSQISSLETDRHARVATPNFLSHFAACRKERGTQLDASVLREEAIWSRPTPRSGSIQQRCRSHCEATPRAQVHEEPSRLVFVVVVVVGPCSDIMWASGRAGEDGDDDDDDDDDRDGEAGTTMEREGESKNPASSKQVS